jgi:bacteriorhodopsin
MFLTVLLVILAAALAASAPVWPYSRRWGYYPIGGIGAILLVLLVLRLEGKL